MTSKLKKITIITIFLVLILLMLGGNIKATIEVGGGTFYTKDDISWTGYNISVDGEWFYCRNHSYGLTKLLRDSTGSLTTRTTATSTSSSAAETSAIAKSKSTAESLGWSFSSSKKSNTLRALSLEFKDWEEITEPEEEVALFAFSSKYYTNPSDLVQKAVWDYLSQHSDLNYDEYCASEGPNEINQAASYYVNVWLKTNKADIQSDDSNAKARVLGKDYIVGPFFIKYNDTVIGRVAFCEEEEHKITDQSGNVISGAQITNVSGSPMGGGKVPNGEPFYIKFPYNETMRKLNIDITLKSIKDVSAKKRDVITKAHDFAFVITSEVHEDSSYFKHSSSCPSDPSGSEEGATYCPYCSGSVNTTYEATAEGKVEDQGEATSKYQNMVQIDGDVEYEYPEIHLSAPLGPTHRGDDDDDIIGGDDDDDNNDDDDDDNNDDDDDDDDDRETIEMELAGYVWEDGAIGKDQVINGSLDSGESRLEGIEVRLYNATLGTLAQVHGGKDGSGSTNPTITDKNGFYKFDGINPIYKYYVQFTYDGMLYTNTYGAGVPEYNTQAWNVSSKGSEVVSERSALNEKFVTISSYPSSYKTTAIFGGNYLTDGYNRIYDIDSNLVKSYKNKITDQLRSYLSSNKRLEDGASNYINNIYLPIINNSQDQTEAKQVLQYIWDSRINSYAGEESEQDGKVARADGKYYPYYDKFALVDDQGNKVTSNNSTTTWQGYRIIYNGQLHINLGVVRRPTTDLQLEQDLVRTVVSINGKDETYTYGTFSSKGIKLNPADAQIEQNVAAADYNYKEYSGNLSSEIEGGTAAYPEDYARIQMYVTYRLNIKNNSSMPTSIDEIATYIDSKFYSYSDLYTTTSGMKIKGVYGTYLYPDSDTSYAEKDLTDYDANSFGLSVNPNSKYGTGSETGKSMGTDLYISFNDTTVILEQNQIISVYITYRLGENSTTNAKFNCTYQSPQAKGENHAYAILQDLFKDINPKKIYIYTHSEINAYSTFFKKENDPTATQAKYSSYYDYSSALSRGYSYRAAGIFDALSIPGNLDKAQMNSYEQNNQKSEDDWDKASTFVLVDLQDIRKIKGNVWETVGDPANKWADTTEYPKYNQSYSAENITVELVEIKNGTEYVRGRTTTASDGSYEFRDYIPGLYTIRFIYGDSTKYDTVQYSKYTTFTINEKEQKSAYNGQFYQSGKANPKTNDNQYWYAVEEDDRYSDAYDEAIRRKEVNELLQTHTYKDVVNVLKHPTDYRMEAYTSLLDIEVEKARTTTSSGQKPGYTISNVDFALTPRTEAKLSMNKEVTHIKLILQNGTVQFDADTATIREQGVPAVVQAAQGNDITISMLSELIDGSTLEITYTITVTNESEEDTVTYYKDSNGNIVALGFYKEDPTKIIYYEDGLIRTYNNQNTFERNSDETWMTKITNGTTAMRSVDITKTETIETTTRPDVLADFVANNLTFTKTAYTGASMNDGWDLFTGRKEDFEKEYYKQKDSDASFKPDSMENMIDEAQNISQEVYDNNTIVLANQRNPLVTTDLRHGESVSSDIILSKVISVNEDYANASAGLLRDDKSYSNHARILSINNTVSRIQDMTAENLKHTTENVVISDPTGIGNVYIIILLTLTVAVIIAVGIVLIKKYVIK